MKHGFKAAAERRALTERETIGLDAVAPLDPRALADARGYPVIALGDLPGVPVEHLAQLRERDAKAFSAAAVVLGSAAIIVVNDGHSRARQANSITHELAHLLLGHEPVPAFAGPGVRTLTKTDEDEADWLAGCLLVPKSGIRPVMSQFGDDVAVAAKHFRVSIELMRWRHNVTSHRRRS
jgi:hypothetical protein